MIISPKDGHPVPGCALYGELIDHLMSEMTNKGIAIPLDLRYSKDYFDQHVTDRLTVQSEGGLAGMYSHLPPPPTKRVLPASAKIEIKQLVTSNHQPADTLIIHQLPPEDVKKLRNKLD
ncbi:hypothetical protein KEM48_001214 [Puccinia striiformis f. sp. tritici PST-130]|nr:hypothetical protein KEM48_001214 [Puccinia striiformis f. sp. tritici PST-130]